MKRALLLIGLIAVMGGAGYAAGLYLAPPPVVEPPKTEEQRQQTLYDLPLGKFTVQVVKPTRFFNIRFELSVFIEGAANYEMMNGGLSRSRMREEVLRHLSTMVETTLWVNEIDQAELNQDELALTIARKLYQTYPMVRSARIQEFATSRVDR